MDNVKCPSCGKVLFEAEIKDGKVRKICPRCKNVITLLVDKGDKKITINK